MATGFKFPTASVNNLQANYDLIVIGSGSAGMTAAIEAAERGLSVAIFEKMPSLGGNTMRASTGMNAAHSSVQFDHHIVDNTQSFYDDTMRGGHFQNDPELLAYFTEHANQAIAWLNQHGIILNDLTFTGGMSERRAHRPSTKAPVGAYLAIGLQKIVQHLNIPIFPEIEVTELLMHDQQIAGVKINNQTIGTKDVLANTVLIASGGYAKNQAYLQKYAPDLVDYKTTNHDGATGDGMKLATAVGAALVDMNKIQVHPTVQQDFDHVYLIGEGLRGEGAILINQAGQRFVNELATRSDVVAAINTLADGSAYLIGDQGIWNAFPALNFYNHVGLVQTAPTIVELTNTINVPAASLEQTVNTWNNAQRNAQDAEFGRTTGMERGIEQAPYFAIHIAPAIHYTMGGIKINAKAEVINEQGAPIKGLYAAGEVTGGLHGDNRIGGNSIAETVVFGRQAGQQAVKYHNHLTD